MKYSVVLSLTLFLSLLVLLAIAPPAEAAFCRQLSEHAVCIVNIKRSAKYHWEYRADVSIDGVKRPTEIYNCRDRTKVRADGIVVPFKSNGPGPLICTLLDR